MSAVRWSRGALAVAAAAAIAAGCSSSDQAKPPSTTPTSNTAQAGPSLAPGQVGISPEGVTTAVGTPSGATEEEFYQACHWARLWMTDKEGDPHAQIEPYLAMVQASPSGENGTWHTPWAQLTPERQAGVILAAQWAADGGCD